MGSKVGFFESTASNKNDGNPTRTVTVVDTLDGIKTYTNAIDEYSNTESLLRPYVGWGGVFSVAGMTLSPYADIAFGIYDREVIDKYSSYTEVNGVKQNIQKQIGAGQNSGYLNPYGKIGAWVDFAKKETVQTRLGLSYALDLRLYGNDAEGLGSVDGTVSWAAGYVNRETKYSNRTLTESNLTYTINEQSLIAHTITPTYKITGEPGENFKVGFSANLPVTIQSNSSKNYTRTKVKTVTKYDWDLPGLVREEDTINYTANGNSETSYLQVNLNLNLGASYQLIPDRFGLNAGISAYPVRYLQTVVRRIPGSVASVATVKETQDDGSVTLNSKTVTLKTEADQVTENSTWQQYTATLRGGFTFNFNSNAALDLAASNGSFTADSFNLDLTTVNVIFTFKY